jgi:hypothetical protein
MATAGETPRRGRGRPPKDPGKGTRRNYAFRMSDQTRDMVVAAADKSGRSMSEELERRVEQSFQAEGTEVLAKSLLNGSDNLYVLLSRVSSLVSTIENYTDKSGSPLGSRDWKAHEPTRAAVRAGVVQLIEDLTAPVRTVDHSAIATREARLADKIKTGAVSEEDKQELRECAQLLAISHLETISRAFAGILSGSISLQELSNIYKPMN